MSFLKRFNDNRADCKKEKEEMREEIEEKEKKLEAEAVRNAIAEGKLRRKAREIESTLRTFENDIREIRYNIGSPLLFNVNVIDDSGFNENFKIEVRNTDEFLTTFANRLITKSAIECDFLLAYAAVNLRKDRQLKYEKLISPETQLKDINRIGSEVYLQFRLDDKEASENVPVINILYF